MLAAGVGTQTTRGRSSSLGDGVKVSTGHIFCAPAQVLRWWAAQNPTHSVRICSPTHNLLSGSEPTAIQRQWCHNNDTTYWLVPSRDAAQAGCAGVPTPPANPAHKGRSCIQKTIALRHQKQRLLGTLLDSSASKRAATNCTTHPKVSLYNSCQHIIELLVSPCSRPRRCNTSTRHACAPA